MDIERERKILEVEVKDSNTAVIGDFNGSENGDDELIHLTVSINDEPGIYTCLQKR